ncbi:MAG: DUF2867 domain-containing protein [Gracilibacteraceae bacterium]|nr:DUF2867 domain-containing protein [Gracilibacteraceae bacterium]
MNFRISLLKEKHDENSGVNTLTITTMVTYNNIFGRLYFLLIKPFHKIIVPIALKAMINDLEKNMESRRSRLQNS